MILALVKGSNGSDHLVMDLMAVMAVEATKISVACQRE